LQPGLPAPALTLARAVPAPKGRAGALGRRTAIGGVLLVGARLLARLIDLGTMLVLARILEPKDFGLVAIAMSVVSIVEAALELPVNAALVRLPVIAKSLYDTAFTLSLLRGLALTAILLACAWPFALAYADPRLALLVCVLSLAPVARGLISPCLAGFQKKMSFWRDFAIEIGGKLVGFACAVGLALTTGSYWSIAVGAVSFTLAMAICSYALAPYRPRLSLSGLPVFASFVGWLSIAQIISAVNWQFERLLLGQLKTTTALGLFTAASDIASIPFLAVFGPILRPLLAAFSLLRDDRARLAKSYQTAATTIVALGLPLLIGESLVAAPAVRLILGERWMGAAPLMQWLPLSLIPGLFAMPATPLIMAVGDTKVVLQRNILEFAVKLPIAVLGAIWFGFAGVIASRCISEVVVNVFSMIVARRLIGLAIAAQLLAPWRSVVAALAMAAAVALWNRQFAGVGDVAQTARRLIETAAFGAAVYCGASWALWRLSGRPGGVEAAAAAAIGGVVRRFLPVRRRGSAS
jgi:PST family polysaccharide transporter